MRHLIDSTLASIAQKNWYAALTLALNMPDICGRLQDPSQKSQARFEKWFDRYMLPSYQRLVGVDRQLHTFLCASDCYALRCAFLHQGEFTIDDQRAQKALGNFHFIEPPNNNNKIHMNQINGTLQLQVDIFCEQMCNGADLWMTDFSRNAEVTERISKMGEIKRLA